MEAKILVVIIMSFVAGLAGLGIVFFKIRKDIIKKDNLEARPHITR